jgi:uncharacterized protein YgfB (UPF0149 family)
MAELPDYEDIADCLGDHGAGVAAAEAHGTLCGLLCTAARDLPDAWINNTLADAMREPGQGPVGARSALSDLHGTSLTALTGGDMSFCPLLPADDLDLEARTAALAAWCQGFLYGLALRGLRDFSDMEGEIREFLEDMAQISRAELESESGERSEQDEVAYAELVEYIRVGVQLFYDAANPGGDTTSQPDLH